MVRTDDEQIRQQAETAYVLDEMQRTMDAARALVRHGAWDADDYAAFCDQIDRGLAAAEYSGRDARGGRR